MNSLPTASDPNSAALAARRSAFNVLASTAAFSGYLALLGGLLLALRFWHAGIPVIQAVSAVPVSTLITTALIEVFVPLLGFAGGLLVSLLAGLPGRSARDSGQPLDAFDRRFSAGTKWVAAVVLICVAPFNIWGLTFFGGLLAIIFAERWTGVIQRHAALSSRRKLQNDSRDLRACYRCPSPRAAGRRTAQHGAGPHPNSPGNRCC